MSFTCPHLFIPVQWNPLLWCEWLTDRRGSNFPDFRIWMWNRPKTSMKLKDVIWCVWFYVINSAVIRFNPFLESNLSEVVKVVIQGSACELLIRTGAVKKYTISKLIVITIMESRVVQITVFWPIIDLLKAWYIITILVYIDFLFFEELLHIETESQRQSRKELTSVNHKSVRPSPISHNWENWQRFIGAHQMERYSKSLIGHKIHKAFIK